MEKVRRRFQELSDVATSIATGQVDTPGGVSTHGEVVSVSMSHSEVDDTEFTQWRTSVQALLDSVFGVKSSTATSFRTECKNGIQGGRWDNARAFQHARAVFLSAKEQYEGGYIFEVRNLVHAEVFSDELEQAEYFLQQGYKTPAAVIAGVVLETTLRSLCEQTENVEPADKLNRMNDDLAKAGVYNKMRADQLRAWAKIRNDAAHGNPDEFSDKDVELMIQGVRDFVANQLS